MNKIKRFLWVLHPSEEITEWGILKGVSLEDMIDYQLEKINKVSFLGIAPIEKVGDLKQIYIDYLPDLKLEFKTIPNNNDLLTKKSKKELILNLIKSGNVLINNKRCKLISLFDITDTKNVNLVGYYNYV